MRRIGRLRSDASPSKVARDRMAADDAHHQARAGAGVAEIERVARREQRAEARAPARSSGPAPRRSIVGAERLAGLAGAQHVVALEQALDARQAAGKQAEQEGAVRDRLVAGRPHAAAQGRRRGARSAGGRYAEEAADMGSSSVKAGSGAAP